LWTPSSKAFVYDPNSNQWSQKASILTPRGTLAAGVVDGKLFAIGGANKKNFRLINTNANEMYDPESDQWISLAPVPNPRDHLTVSSFNGKVYAIGG
jgi:N-acetylneuraminic acid mutarotase